MILKVKDQDYKYIQTSGHRASVNNGWSYHMYTNILNHLGQNHSAN